MYETLQTTCIYCHPPIDRDEPGWGFQGENDTFHCECMQMNEGVVVG